ncbi:MAG: prolipoprotein diacylglyceryl transferase [Desulfococcaceae bacterium]
MIDELFVAGLGLLLGLALVWGFRALPGERWQILAAMPRAKNGDGHWAGDNLTYYGVFNANAYVLGLAVFVLLMGAAGAPLIAILATAGPLLLICVPASRWVARIVEKKRYTFTVGGASFVGIVISPWLVLAMNAFVGQTAGFSVGVLAFLAALSVGYAIGEGVGRLACISFGCCYGKPLAKCHPALQRLFRKWRFVFLGDTKKIAYADGLAGEAVVPIQGVTAVLYCAAGLLGIYLFLKGFFAAAFLMSLTVTQLWRVFSECFRADYRGGGKLSAYQIMGLLAVPYGALIAFLFPAEAHSAAALGRGLAIFWRPEVILGLQFFWLLIFLYTGRSKVTAASMAFHVVRDRV